MVSSRNGLLQYPNSSHPHETMFAFSLMLSVLAAKNIAPRSASTALKGSSSAKPQRLI
jgi:hypothetical protein